MRFKKWRRTSACAVTLLLKLLALGVGRITTLKFRVALAPTARLEPLPPSMILPEDTPDLGGSLGLACL